MADAADKKSEQQPAKISRQESSGETVPFASGTTTGTSATTMEMYDDQDAATQQHLMDMIAHELLQQQVNPQLLPQQHQLQQLPQQQAPHRQLAGLTLQTKATAATRENWQVQPNDPVNPAAPAATCSSSSSAGDDVKLGAAIGGEAPSSLEDMEGVEQSPELYPMQPPQFIQNFGASSSSEDQVMSMEQQSSGGEAAFYQQFGGGPESYRSSSSSGEEQQRISLSTVLEVLGIPTYQQGQQQEQPIQYQFPIHIPPPVQEFVASPAAQVVPDSTHVASPTSPRPDESMVLNSMVMWAPPPEAQAYVKQQESLVNPQPQPTSQPTPLNPVAAADFPVPRAISALPTAPVTVKSISGPVSITNASTGTKNSPSATSTSAMSAQGASSSTASNEQVPQPQLPEYHEMVVRGYYRNKEMFKTPVGNAHGCILYYKEAKKAQEEDLSQMTLVEYPETPQDMTEKNAHLTTKILEVIEKGVRIRCVDGCIYATRRCRSKVFVCSSQDTKGDSKELKRDEESLVFNPYLFEKRYRKWLLRQTDDVKGPKPPNIVFTFAQRWSWASHHPLMNCLVYSVVTPMRARTQLEWGPDTNQKVEGLSLNRDYTPSMLQISQPSTGSSTEISK